jgi:hypothetical protein
MIHLSLDECGPDEEEAVYILDLSSAAWMIAFKSSASLAIRLGSSGVYPRFSAMALASDSAFLQKAAHVRHCRHFPADGRLCHASGLQIGLKRHS